MCEGLPGSETSYRRVHCPRAGTWICVHTYKAVDNDSKASFEYLNIKIPTTTRRSYFSPCHHNFGTSSTSFPSLTLSPLSTSPCTSVEPTGPSSGKTPWPHVVSSWFLKQAGSTVRDPMVESFVTAVRLASRRMMRNGAMTCFSPRLDNNVQGSGKRGATRT